MQKDKIVAGLDIGTTKICAVVGKQNEYGKLEILGMGTAVSEGVNRGMITNIDKTVTGIAQAMQEAERQSGVDIGEVNVGIAGQHIKGSMHHGSITRSSNEDEIKVEDVNRLTNDMYRTVTPAGTKIIHVIPQDYTVDYESGIKDPVGMSGVKIEGDFQIITAHSNAINNLHRCVRKANLEIDNLMLEPIASSLAVLTAEEKEAGVALIDIGGGTTDIAIFYDNILRHTAVIPFGGNIITSDIKQGCMVMQNQAELLKTRFGHALAEEARDNEVVSIPGLRNRPPKEVSVKNLAYIIEARMEEIVELIHTELIMSGLLNRLAGGLVVTGGGAQLQGVQPLFELMTGLDTRIGYPNEHLSRGKVEDIKSPQFATAVGLVLSGFRSVDDRQNYYSEVQSQQTPDRNTKREKTEKTGSDFFRRFLDRTRDLLIDDLDNKGEY
ncbi:cell division protein FtsA [Catalinimonas alkaloidigena]|uniref:Cell division protein FtsA n=1 Tax=Catalinimonas alkaloidigena TaxID=1075417 RepID=A0A1G9J9E8_9BACT|nr:cell division protein FtsA [Catalinimonas alkaloidigena]SDL34179.1 cell division protein FtsA [Catalinimonas alkaloidigena]